VLSRVRALIERLLPWYDPELERRRDAHAAATVKAADQVTVRIRDGFGTLEGRVSGKRR